MTDKNEIANPYRAPGSTERPAGRKPFFQSRAPGWILFLAGLLTGLWAMLYAVGCSGYPIAPRGFVSDVVWPVAFFGSPVAIIAGMIWLWQHQETHR